ncbi:hypothetical protein AB0J82_15525 [Asanoa sp. NPDC049518]|uniref:hypothetical protein n=1 Tax=unclassified Asanoa TaxID=2685164 RepID=UPI00344255BF
MTISHAPKVLAILAVALLAACAETGGPRTEGAASATAGPSRCAYNRPANATGDPCRPRPPDGPARATLTAAERASAEPARTIAERAVASALRCPTCASAEPADVRAALTAAGFPDAVARPARADDPAPPGTIVYAVPAGAACVLGYYDPSTGSQRLQIQGSLYQGHCL